MTLEPGLNPRKRGKLDNHGQGPRKLPLPIFIERLYRKAVRKDRRIVVLSRHDARACTKKKTVGTPLEGLPHDQQSDGHHTHQCRRGCLM